MAILALKTCRTISSLPRSLNKQSVWGLMSRRLATQAETTRLDRGFGIPVVDFGRFLRGDIVTRRATAKKVVDAFKGVGFVYLTNHGVESGKIENIFDKSKAFFELPLDKKMALQWEDPRSNRGYVAAGRERLTQSVDATEIATLRENAPEYKESMEIGREWDTIWKNRWPEPSDVPDFKPSMLDFFQACHALYVQVMRSVALGLDLDESYFDDKIHEQYHNLRLLAYPSIDAGLMKGEGQARAGAHSDYGTLSFVFQDSVGGLEVQNPHSKLFHSATPIPGTVVVNVGDLLGRWSNDVLRSTLHRVVAPKANKDPIIPARQSVVFFCSPNSGAEITCLPTCLKAGEKPKYAPVQTEAYIVGRLRDTYA